jgi:PAS domain S-box-containing protein
MPSSAEVSRSLTEDDYPGLGRYVWRPGDGGLTWSPGLLAIYGRAAAPASEAEFMACLHPADRVRVEGETEAFLSGQADSYSHSFRIIRPDGGVRYILDRARIDRDAEGRVTGIHGLNVDVTDFPHLAHASMDAESDAAALVLDEPSRGYPDRERLEVGQSASGLILADIDYTRGTISLSAGAARLYGLGETAITVPREALHATFHADDVARLRDEIRESLDARIGGRLVTEHRVVHPDGAVRWLKVRKRIDFTVRDGRRRPDRGILAALDVTERRVAEQRLAERERQLALFIEHAPAAIAMFDRDLRYIAHSRRYLTDYGLPEDAILTGRRHYDIAPDIPDRWRAIHRRVLAGETLSAEEDPFVRSDGKTDWVRWTMAPWYGDQGEIGGAILFSEVITDRIETRRALRDSEARYRALFESINAGFCVVQVKLDGPGGLIDYRVVEANPAFYERTGFPRAILGQWLRAAAPDLEEHWYAIYGGVARTGEPARFEERSEALGRWFDVYAFRIDRPEDGRVAILFHDITDRMQHEEHVRTLLREVNHRSKNMLSLVKAIARRTAASGSQDFLERFSERIAALATNQDVLVRSEWRRAPLHELIRSQLSHFADLLDRRITIAGPPIEFNPDAAEKLGMALHELATNASKYGALSNDVGRIGVTWDADAVRFAMSWREEDGPAVTPPERTGFGSVVSQQLLATSLDGEVEATYAPSGFAWRLSCPLAAVAASGPHHAPTPGEAAGGATGGVLLVEDDALLALSMKEVLEEAGLRVIGPAATADRALNLIARAPPDFGLLDVNLGAETSERVAQELTRMGVRFACVSAYSRDQAPDAFLQAPFFSKPINESALLQTIMANKTADHGPP